MLNFVLLTVLLIVQPLEAHCPCEDEALCVPLSFVPNQEVFAFMNVCNKKIWKTFDWNKLTTLAVSECYDPELICLAHLHNVRVVIFGTYPDQHLLNETKRMEWIEEKLSLVKEYYLDGFNIDFESEIPRASPESAALTALARETMQRFHDVLPFSQVTFDVAWSPNDIDRRSFDYLGLSQVVDFLFVMAYDEQSQIHDRECTARSNSGFQKTESGLLQYMDLGIPANKLVLGVPWYGYDYECITLMENQTCYIKKVPFRGVNCSDAAGKQLSYSTIVEKFLPNATSDPMWDLQQQSPYFNFVDEGTGYIHQIRYDNPQSLMKKFELLARYGLHGVGMWSVEQVDYTNTTKGQEQRAEMWGILPSPVKFQYHVLQT